MKLLIKRKEKIMKSFRIEKDLLDQMQHICVKANLSLNQLIELFIQFALENYEVENK